MIVKHGILLQDGQTTANVGEFRVFTEEQSNFFTIILKEGDEVTAENGGTQRLVTEWATGKIVEWELRDENEDDSVQVGIINDAVTAFNYPDGEQDKEGNANPGRTVKITTERMIASTPQEVTELGKKPS